MTQRMESHDNKHPREDLIKTVQINFIIEIQVLTRIHILIILTSKFYFEWSLNTKKKESTQ